MVKKWKKMVWLAGAIVVLGLMACRPKEALDAARALVILTGENKCAFE